MNRSAAGGLLAALCIALLSAVAPASAAQAAEVASFGVAVVAANGSGCPNANATATAVDGSSFTVASNAFFAWSGAGAATTAARQNCQYALQVTPPDGYTYAVQGADYSGYALVGDGITGTQAARYYFQGEADTASVSHPLASPYSGSWSTADAFESDELVFAPCDSVRQLDINTEVRVTPTSTGLHWVYQDPSFTVHLTWQACS
jgi:opacity protein-like surface antigen